MNWVCRRTNKPNKGAFYFKTGFSTVNKSVGKDHFGFTSLDAMLDTLSNDDKRKYTWQDHNYDTIWEEIFYQRLSCDCNLNKIKIPDGGFCCDFVASSLLYSEELSGDYFKYLNSLRCQLELDEIVFDKENINQQLRLLYSLSLTYDYNPNIEELMNKPNTKEYLNDMYSSYVLLYMYELCDKYGLNNIVFQQCCRKFVSMTPQDLGKYGTMWGTDDFLDWFQKVFNIRIFVLNSQTFNDDRSIHCQFINDHLDKDFEKYVDTTNSNDKYFDMNNKDRLIPYGIMIVVMIDSHYENVLKPYDQQSPLIPAGSEKN